MHGKHEVLIKYRTVQGPSPDTSKPRTQGDKRSFHSDKWELEAVLQVRTLTEIGRSEMKEAVRVRNTQVCSIVRCTDENPHIVRHSESRTGVC